MTAQSPETALLAAIRAAALASPAVQAVLGAPPRLFDERPPAVDFPFATIGRLETRPLAASESAAMEHVVNLHVWSRYGGRAEALDVIAALRAALDDQPLAVAGRRLVLLFASYTDVFRTGDGRTTMGVMRLRAVTEPAAV